MIKSNNVNIIFKTNESNITVNCEKIKMHAFSTIPGKKANFINFKMENLEEFDLENELPVSLIVNGIDIIVGNNTIIAQYNINNQHPQYSLNCSDFLTKTLEFEIQ